MKAPSLEDRPGGKPSGARFAIPAFPAFPAHLLLIGACAATLTRCSAVRAPHDGTNPTSSAPARSAAELRAAHYLAKASAAISRTGAHKESPRDWEAYNAACADLTVLLRSADGGSLWNRPLTLTSGGKTYQLRYRAGNRQGVWAPDYFTEFKPARKMQADRVKTPNRRTGVGGELVGVRKLSPREEYSPRTGLAAAVTATLEFEGQTATLVLNDPVKRTTARIAGADHPLAADFSAPLCFYPKVHQSLLGLMEGLHPGRYAATEGFYLLQPYDPDRIPVIYVHGLISTPFIWRDPVNQIQEDPVLRKNYQAIVFSYPTGNPAAYSALKFREGLAEFEKLHPMPHGFVLISHSMGGLVSQMQTETLTPDDWHRTVGPLADKLLAKEGPDSEITRCMVFEANPKAKRVVFISTPHKGANMANQSIGELATHLIRLPLSLAGTLTDALGNEVAEVTGNAKTLPDSVSSLSPENPMLHVLASKKVVPPCHSIIGNRGKPGPLADSSDGVVPYWSSHLPYAKSEVIVPGPHSCYDYPGSIAELKRILHLHLKESPPK